MALDMYSDKSLPIFLEKSLYILLSLGLLYGPKKDLISR